MGAGWNIVKFFSVKDVPYIFRYNKNSAAVEIFRINAEHPFEGGDLGTRVYHDNWTPGYTVVRFFIYNGHTYLLHLKSGSGFIRITEINNDAPFSGGRIGTIRFESDWHEGWDNLNVFTHSNGKTYMFYEKSAQGDFRMKLLRPDAFSHSNPFLNVAAGVWKKGWTYTMVYKSNGGYRLLHMKQ